MRSERDMYQLILTFAQEDPRIRGVLLNGSRANPAATPDRFRDFDIVYLVTDVAPYKEGDISAAFGEVLVLQRTDENQLFDEHFPHMACYLMQFADGNRIDLTIARVEDYASYCWDDRLCVVLLDKDGFLPALPPPDESTHGIQRPSAQVFQECRNEFWWTAPYVSKGLWRGQLPYAQHMLEECTRPMLRLMLSWLTGAQKGFPVYPGKAGWNLEHLLPQDLWERYLSTYAPCGQEALFQALDTACALFTEVSHRTGEQLGYAWSDQWDDTVPRFMKVTQKEIASLPPEESWGEELFRQIQGHKRKEKSV